MSIIKLKLFISWDADHDAYTQLWKQRLLPASGLWTTDNITLQWTNDAKEADYHVIVNYPRQDIQYDVNKAILLRMEPPQHNYYGFWNPDPSKYRYLLSDHNSIEWHISRSFDQLTKDLLPGNSIIKSKVLSTITSGVQNDPGHKLRYAFLAYLETVNGFDFYGRHHSTNKAYRGSLPSRIKDGGLLDYKYTFAAENCQVDDYFTEKLVDAILCECLCFYWGCPNISKFLDDRAFICIDLTKPEAALKIINQAIANDEYTKRLPYIRAAKNKIINHLQIMPSLVKAINNIKQQDIIYNKLFKDPTSYWQLPHLKELPPGLRNAVNTVASSGQSLILGDITATARIKVDSKHHDKRITVVTCFFGLPNNIKRDTATYKKFIQHFAKLKCNMVIFTDLANYQYIKALRPVNTRIYLKEITEFKSYQYIDYWNYCYDIDRQRFHSPEMYAIWAERHLSLVTEAIAIDPFKSVYFFWIDIGSIRDEVFPAELINLPSYDKVVELLPKGKFMLATPFGINHNLSSSHPGIDCKNGDTAILDVLFNRQDGKSANVHDMIQSGFLGGEKHLWSWWSSVYLKHLNLFITHGIYGGKEEVVMNNIYFNEPDIREKVKLFYGQNTWNNKAIDPWFTSLYRFS